MAGIDDVARLAGVSTATVSRALSGRGQVSAASRDRVLAAAAELGYVVSSRASSLATGRTRSVGVVVPFVERWFFGTVLSGISAALTAGGYDLTLYRVSPDRDERREVFAAALRRQRVDAVITVAIELDAPETEALAALGLPIVTIGGVNGAFSSISIDETAMARCATEHLLELGHRAIAYLGADEEFDVDFRVPARRRAGYDQALQAAGVAVDDALLASADFTIEGGYRAATQLLNRAGARPTAIFAASDEMAIGALQAARDAGFRVPEDLSVIGIDGHELGDFFQLTTVDQFPFRQGERAARMALAELDEEQLGDAASALPFALVVRGTTDRI